MSGVVTRPSWLNKKVNLQECSELKRLLRSLKLHTVCESALCPNISECFSKRTATFLILGDICTRNCGFCNVKKGNPLALDEEEPLRVARAAEKLNLKYVVITSVTRDDLPDGGAEMFYRTITEVKKILPLSSVEVLIPDFSGDREALRKVCEAQPEVIGHNLETVPSLYKQVRRGASYERSLRVLKSVKEINPDIYTKSGIMLGLGETEAEVMEVLRDLRNSGCEFLSIGQYLCPSHNNVPVREYVHPERFNFYRQVAQELGFSYVKSSPYTRSSYCAQEYLFEGVE